MRRLVGTVRALLPISHGPKREVKPSRELFLCQLQLRAQRTYRRHAASVRGRSRLFCIQSIRPANGFSAWIQQRTELRLVAGTPRVKHQTARDGVRDVAAAILHYHRERRIRRFESKGSTRQMRLEPPFREMFQLSPRAE